MHEPEPRKHFLDWALAEDRIRKEVSRQIQTASGQLVARYAVRGAQRAWLSERHQQLVVDTEPGTRVGALDSFDADLKATRRRIALITSREWNGRNVGRLDWREKIQRAESSVTVGVATAGSAPRLQLRAMKRIEDDWHLRMRKADGSE